MNTMRVVRLVVVVMVATVMQGCGPQTDGQPGGQGVATLPDGKRYEGAFRDGQPHGRGVMELPGGRRVEGVFLDRDLLDGPAVVTMPDGRRYEGELRDKKVHGQGVMTWPDGGRYEGEFREDSIARAGSHGIAGREALRRRVPRG